MLRLSLILRLTLTLLVASAALWIFAVAHWLRQGHGPAEIPLADRVLALCEAIEASPPSARAGLIRALRAPDLELSLDSQVLGTQAFGQIWQAGAAPLPPALSTRLAPRRVRAIAGEANETRGIGRIASRLDAPLMLGIELLDGARLQIKLQSPVPRTAIGLPIGYGAGIFGTLVAFFALLVMQREAKPVIALAKALDSVQLGGGPVTLPKTAGRAPEIVALISAFDRLQTRLAALLTARMAMIGGLSHDVRTFATRLRLRIEGIEDPEERARAAQDIEDMIHLLDDALLASRVGSVQNRREIIDLAELIRRESEDRIAAGASLRLHLPQGERMDIQGDRLALRRIIGNLLENARLYAKHAEVTLQRAGNQALILVDDDGPGIPEAQRLALLEPFTRLEGSRSRGTGGAGLGLAIARSLAEEHLGRLEIARSPQGGARILVFLPLAPPNRTEPVTPA